MRLLLDTHVFLWFVTDDARLPLAQKLAVEDPNKEVFLSVVSLWEVLIKERIGRLPLPRPAKEYIPEL